LLCILNEINCLDMKAFNLLASVTIMALIASCTNNSQPLQRPEKIKVVNQGVQIDCIDEGNGDTTLLFVHGWCINKTYWLKQVAKFKKNYRVVAIDLPGFGKSGKNRTVWNNKNFSADISATIAQLDLKNVVLIGHSMAGDIIIQAAIDNPSRVIGLIGVDNLKTVGVKYTPGKKDKEEYEKAVYAIKHDFKNFAVKYVDDELLYKTTSANIRKKVLNDVANADSVIAAACLLQDDFDEASKLVQTRKKIYLINSDVTPTDTSGFIAKNIPFKITYVHATGHFPMIEKPAEFNSRLEEILEDLKGSGNIAESNK